MNAGLGPRRPVNASSRRRSRPGAPPPSGALTVERALRLARDRAGVISVELALLVGLVLLPMIMGAYDVAQLWRMQEQLNQVLRAAFFYAYANAGTVTEANVQTIAAAAYGSSPAPTVTATIKQYCIAPATGYPATGTPATPNSGSCTSGYVVETYMLVNATVTFSPTFLLNYITQNGTLAVSANARIQ